MTLRALVAATTITALTACFATLQTAEVQEGFHLAAGAGVLADQTRDGRAQGTDVFMFVVPSLGVAGDDFVKLQFSTPIGIYWEEGLGVGESGGTQAATPLFQQQVKLGLNQSGADKLALLLELSWVVIPGSLTLIYSRDLQRLTPYVALKRILTYGAAGDDPFITRYQEEDQSIWVLALGTELSATARPAVELGILRNSYREPQALEAVTLYNLFLGLRVGF